MNAVAIEYDFVIGDCEMNALLVTTVVNNVYTMQRYIVLIDGAPQSRQQRQVVGV